MLIGKMRCTGKEMNVMACPHDKPNCDTKSTAGVVCFYNDGEFFGNVSYIQYFNLKFGVVSMFVSLS